MRTTPIVSPTSEAPLSLKDADWLSDERLQHLMHVIAGSDEEVRVVGGAVRNALMGHDIADVDLATTATPAIVIERARKSGMKPVPTGIDHGTVTVVVAGKPYEVTTLREDVETDGRRATVKFGRDWAADAMRRDFTVNALYATAAGDIIDFVGGLADCAARHIRFIGDPETRIREDYLRILRLFRFQATFCDGPIDPPGLAAAVRLREGLLTLSSERIGQEMLKLIVADHAPEMLRIMRTTGILALALGTDAIDLDRFDRLHGIIATLRASRSADPAPDPAPLLLASLAVDGPEGCEHLVKRLRLSNAARDRMIAAWTSVKTISPDMGEREVREALFRIGPKGYRDALLLRASAPNQTWPIPRLVELVHLGLVSVHPKLPISGRDLLALGIPAGPDLGRALHDITERWIASDFALTKTELLARIRQGDR